MSSLIPNTNITLPKSAILVPLFERPIFPGTLIPIFIENQEELQQLQNAVKKNDGYISLTYVKNSQSTKLRFTPTDKKISHLATKDLKLKHINPIGVLGKILRIVVNPNIEANSEKIAQVIISCMTRVNIKTLRSSDAFFPIAEFTNVASDAPLPEKEQNAYAVAMFSKVKELIALNPLFAEEMKMVLSTNAEEVSSRMLYLIASLLNSAPPNEMQKLLESSHPRFRFEIILELLQKEIEVSRIKEKITKKIEGDVSKQQHDFFLREQLKAIKKELGMEEDEKTGVVRKLLEAKSKLKLTPTAEKVFREEISKLESQDPRSQEYPVIRSYLEWLVALPWGVFSKENSNLKNAEKILNKDHFGMKEVKERLLTIIAIRILRESTSGQVITLVGPPGVGKTSVGKSIARALGRQFYRFSLGGMRDEAEVRGHRRTYVGAMPGKFIQAMKYVNSSNPVIMLDEIDKVSSTYHGDPSSALLEVLDKEQNYAFNDLYLDVPFDFSKTLFIATANQLDTIPSPLLDRMEIVELSGYLPEEKRHIAKKFFIPRLLKETGLGNKKVTFSAKTIDMIISGYARESGVRGLERNIRNILAKNALQVVRGIKQLPIAIQPEEIVSYLGNPKFTQEESFTTPKPGIVSGLAWTAMGGTTFNIESIAVGLGKELKLTGSLGKVMEESAQLAFSYIKNLLTQNKDFKKNSKFEKESINHSKSSMQHFFSSTIHLHVPSGATPKDGPSAGIAMALALYSLATKSPIRSQLAMTGELTLTGNVFPIGGLKEKIIAGKRANKKELIVPEANRRDVAAFPSQVTKNLRFYFVKTFMDVLKVATSKNSKKTKSTN